MCTLLQTPEQVYETHRRAHREQFKNRAADLGCDEYVEINERPAEFLSQQGPYRSFAAGHKPHKKNLRFHHLELATGDTGN